MCDGKIDDDVDVEWASARVATRGRCFPLNPALALQTTTTNPVH